MPIVSYKKLMIILGCILPHILMASPHSSTIDKAPQCDFGYVKQGALAMHGEPDIDKTNMALCKLYHNKQSPIASTLHISEQERFGGLNYLIPKGDVSYSVRPWVVDTLMYRSPFEPFTMYPNIVSIDSINDQRSFVIFKVNEKATFSDGIPITGRDVLFSFNKLRQNGLYNYRIAYKNITAKLITPFKVRFDFKVKNRELPLILGLMPIFSAKTTDQDFLQQDLTPPLMASPYKIIKADIGKSLTLEKDPHYWGLSTPQGKARFGFKTVRFDFFQNDIASFENLRAGQSDFFYENNLKRLNTSYDFPAIKEGSYKINKIATGRPAGMYSFILNMRKPLLQNIHLRKALFLAFNFNAVNQDYLFNSFEQSDSLFTGSALAHYHNGFKKNKFPKNHRKRLKLAHKILKDNGYYFKYGLLKTPNHRPVTLHLLLNNPNDEKFAGALKKDFEKIGVTLTMQTVDDSLYQHHLTKFDYDMIAYSWYNSISPGIEQKNYWHCDSKNKQGSRNYAGICMPEIDQAITQLTTATSRHDLVKAAAKLDYTLMNGYFFIPLYGQQHYNIIAKKTLIPSVGGATYFAIKP